MSDSFEVIVVMECYAETGHGPPWPDSLVRSVRREVARRLGEAPDPRLSDLH